MVDQSLSLYEILEEPGRVGMEMETQMTEMPPDWNGMIATMDCIRWLRLLHLYQLRIVCALKI